MKKTTNNIRIIIAACLSQLFSSTNALSLDVPHHADKVVNGQLDLSHHNLDEGPFYLDGQWQFVWGELLSPEQWQDYSSKNAVETYKVPGTWSGGPYNDATLTGKGHATYHLRIKNPTSSTQTATLYIPFAQTSYRLLVNGVELSSNGIVGTSKENSTPASLSHRISFPLQGDETEIIYQISNYHLYDGGLRKYFLIGTESDIQHHHDIRLFYSVACVAMLLFFGIYLILMFIFRRSEKTHLYFGLTSIFLAIYTTCVNTSIITIIWPSLDWHIQIRAANSSAAMTLGFALIYILHLFPRDSSRLISYFGVGICLITAMSSFIPAINESTPLYHYFTFFMVGFLLYGLAVFVRALFNRRKGALLVLTPYVLMISVTIFDIYLYQTGQEVYNLAGYGFILFMVTNIYLLAKKYSDSYSEAERLQNSLRQANAMKDEFLATTSHELRTPLNGIIGLSESALEQANSTQLKDSLKLIVANARRLAGLVSNTLDVTRLQHEDVDFLPRAVDISPITRSVMQLCHPLTNNSSVILDYRIDASLPPVLVDENHLQQILYNLIGNAIKYTPTGSITLDAEQHGQMLHISICDTGVGIAKESLAQIFEPYTQISGNHEVAQQGIGLGLPITNKLIELNGGIIKVESEPGQGSCFTVLLPIAQSENTPQVIKNKPLFIEDNNAEQNSAPVQAHNCSGKTILAVDDESVNLTVLSSQLEHAGHRIITASSGNEALDCLEHEAIDLILLDVMMPGMDGLEVCRRVREEYEAAALPIILLTARSQPRDIIEGFSAGANDYITKPFYRQELLARVDAALSIKDNEQLNWLNAQREHATSQLEYAQHHINERISHHGYRVVTVQLDGIILEMTTAKSDTAENTEIKYEELHPLITAEIEKWRSNPLSYLQESAISLDNNGAVAQYHCYASTLLDTPVLILLIESSSGATKDSNDTVTSDPRIALHSLITNTLSCWEQSNNKGKVELAEESKIWSVHIDGSTAKTRTLDKYLRIESIPARPRWKNVTRSAQFVINNSGDSACAEKLKRQLDEFYELMKVVQF